MAATPRGPFPWLVTAFVANLAVTASASFFLGRGTIGREALNALTLVSVAGAAVMFALSWKIIDYMVMRAIRRMAAEVRAIAHGSARTGIEVERYAIVAPLPEAVNEVCARMIHARAELADGLTTATAKAQETSSRLAAILNDLHEGVVVCNQRHQVVLYNQVAFDMLSGSGELGLGRSLFETLAQGPVTHMHDVLTQRIGTAEGGASFLCGSADGRMLLQARMSLARGSDGAAAGYVVTLIDAGPQIAALAKRDALLRAVAEGLVSPLARLRAAASDPHAVEREAAVIERAISRVTIGWQRAISGWWPKTDMQSSDLFAYVARRFDDGAPKVTVTGLPVWLHADSHSLALAVEELVRRVSEASGAREVDLGAEVEDEDSAWLDIVWSGDTVDDAIRAQWLAKPLSALGGMTVRDVLAHHAGESIVHQQRDGRAWLRLPMTKGVERHVIAKATLPTRPEFYDLSLLEQARDTGTLGRRPLRSLTYVVFDTETTGLQPSAGDQMVQIGGVRVVNARILSGESFDRIINPGCPIPPQSIRFHGITDEMVKDKPPLSVVLPQFKAFCADAVLVAHNAAFDLKFLRLRERACGVAFDNPVLDTMILSSYLDGPDTGHSLDDICERLGIVIEHRHTALGDAMVTAAVLLKQIDMLEARGIHTLDEAVKALDLTMALHQRQQAL